MKNSEKAYWISEVADLLDMNVNTLRKYCLLLEKNGYTFKRDQKNQRAFLQNDIIMLQEINRTKRNDRMPLEEVVKVVAARLSSASDHTERTDIMPAITQKNPIILQLQENFQQVAATVNELKLEVQEQHKEIKEQREYIMQLEEKRIKQTDDLLDSWTQRYKQVKEEEQRNKKGWFARLFGLK